MLGTFGIFIMQFRAIFILDNVTIATYYTLRECNYTWISVYFNLAKYKMQNYMLLFNVLTYQTLRGLSSVYYLIEYRGIHGYNAPTVSNKCTWSHLLWRFRDTRDTARSLVNQDDRHSTDALDVHRRIMWWRDGPIIGRDSLCWKSLLTM